MFLLKSVVSIKTSAARPEIEDKCWDYDWSRCYCCLCTNSYTLNSRVKCTSGILLNSRRCHCGTSVPVSPGNRYVSGFKKSKIFILYCFFLCKKNTMLTLSLWQSNFLSLTVRLTALQRQFDWKIGKSQK